MEKTYMTEEEHMKTLIDRQGRCTHSYSCDICPLEHERCTEETAFERAKAYLQDPFKAGSKVTCYDGFKYEKGIVKSKADDFNVFVVYHCDDKWDMYYDYTAQRTPKNFLLEGWKDKPDEEFRLDISRIF